MSATQAISQRDLRLRSKEIMDAVEQGTEFVVTRGGHRVGELIPLRRKRQFVSRAQFVAMSSSAPTIDPDRFRKDLDLLDSEIEDPYER